MNLYTLLEDPTTVRIRLNKSPITLTFNRSTGLGTINKHLFQDIPTKNAKIQTIRGVYGMISLSHATYIIVIKDCKISAWIPKIFSGNPNSINTTRCFEKGKVYFKKDIPDTDEYYLENMRVAYPVYEITDVEFIKVKTLSNKENDIPYLASLSKFFELPGLYFSEFPIYKSFVDQKYNELDFLFNCGLGDEFNQSVRGDCSDFIIKCFQGYISTKFLCYSLNLDDKNVDSKEEEEDLNDIENDFDGPITKGRRLLEETCKTTRKNKIMKEDTEKDTFLDREDNRYLMVLLISRRSWRRVGMRFFSRGIDNQGYPTNFVETEQIICDENGIVSFLQTRGSIPLKWGHKIGIKINPKIIFTENKKKYIADIIKANILNTSESTTKSDNSDKKASIKAKKMDNETLFPISDEVQKLHYGEIFYLNLIQHVKYEKVINDEYKKLLSKHGLNCLNFDFKNKGMEKCCKTRELFVKELKYLIDAYGFSSFIFKNENFFYTEQNGVIRTNCIDCLDRTNVVQSLIGRSAIKKQLRKLFDDEENKCILDCNKNVEDHEDNKQKSSDEENNEKINTLKVIEEDIDEVLKLMYFENGNRISIQYSGTPSLKSSLTKSDRRSLKGFLNDGLFTLKRYFLNRFYHGILTDGYALATNKYFVDRNPKFNRYRISFRLYFSVFIGTAFIVSCIFSDEKHYNISTLLMSLATVVFIFISFLIIFWDYFLNYPRYWNDE